VSRSADCALACTFFQLTGPSRFSFQLKSALPALSSLPQQIKGISAEDVRAFLSTWERPDAAVLGIVGDFEPRQVCALPPLQPMAEPRQALTRSLSSYEGYCSCAYWVQLFMSVFFNCANLALLQMRQLVEASFGSWAAPAGQPAPPQLPITPLPDQAAISGKIFLVDLPGATQGSVAVGEPGGQGPT
jgi:zinc protease